MKRVGDGQAVGPDLKPHPARFYFLNQTIILPQGPATMNWTLAISQDDFHVLSVYNPCNSIYLPKDKPPVCIDAGMVALPVGEWTPFFGAPLVLDAIPREGGEFSVPVWSLGQVVQARFRAERVGDDVLVKKVGPRVVEHLNLDDPTASDLQVLTCDVFKEDTLLLRGESVGCRDRSKGVEWWVDGPIPTIRERWAADRFKAPLATVDDGHGVPTGTQGFSYPVEDALRQVALKVPSAKAILDSPGWRLGHFRYHITGSVTAGPVTCDDLQWELRLLSAAGGMADALATRKACTGGLDADDAKQTTLETYAPSWPHSTRSVRADDGVAAARRLICFPPQEPSVFSYVRPVTERNLTWLGFSGFPTTPGQGGGGATGGTLNSVLVNADTGFILTISRLAGKGALKTLFETGASDCPAAEDES